EREPINPERFREQAEWLAAGNLSSVSRWEYALKTLPRPTGRDTRVIITEYDLPRKVAMPHDVIVDASGMAWYSDFGSQYLGKLDPSTGKVDRKSTRLNSSHVAISYAVFCLKK